MLELLSDVISFDKNMLREDSVTADEILEAIERAGMKAPPVPAKIIKGNDFPFAAACSSRCDCEYCNPDYKMYVWEKE